MAAFPFILHWFKARSVLALTLGMFVSSCYAQMRRNQVYQQYIDQYKELAVEQMHKYRIPASITLAQGVFESGAGRSELARNGNNHFGIKCRGWQGATVYFTDDAPNECFRKYRSVKDSYEDHSLFLTGSQRYKALFQLRVTDYKGWARGLKQAGYATNPQYANRLIDIIELYELYRYDTGKGYDRFIVNHGYRAASDGYEYTIYAFNDNYYVRARKGDTYKDIGRHVGVSYRMLARYNERDRHDVLEEGEVVYLKKKRRKAPKQFKGKYHTVRVGESMYSIAQQYGIRLKSLYKLNRMAPDSQICVGDRLWVR